MLGKLKGFEILIEILLLITYRIIFSGLSSRETYVYRVSEPRPGKKNSKRRLFRFKDGVMTMTFLVSQDWSYGQRHQYATGTTL